MVGVSYPSAESVYSTAPADLASVRVVCTLYICIYM